MGCVGTYVWVSCVKSLCGSPFVFVPLAWVKKWCGCKFWGAWHRWRGSIKFWHGSKNWLRSKSIFSKSRSILSYCKYSLYFFSFLTFVSFFPYVHFIFKLIGLKFYPDFNPGKSFVKKLK